MCSIVMLERIVVVLRHFFAVVRLLTPLRPIQAATYPTLPRDPERHKSEKWKHLSCWSSGDVPISVLCVSPRYSGEGAFQEGGVCVGGRPFGVQGYLVNPGFSGLNLGSQCSEPSINMSHCSRSSRARRCEFSLRAASRSFIPIADDSADPYSSPKLRATPLRTLAEPERGSAAATPMEAKVPARRRCLRGRSGSLPRFLQAPEPHLGWCPVCEPPTGGPFEQDPMGIGGRVPRCGGRESC